MKRTISLKDLEEIVKKIPKTKVERENNSWGDCSVHYDYYISPGDVMYHVRKFLENKNKTTKEK